MRITVHLPDEMAEAVKEAATRENESVSSLMAKAFQEYLVKTRRRYYGGLALKNASPKNVTADAIEVLHQSRKEHARRRI